MKKDKNKQRGVTLLALVIAIVIILILTSIATYSGIGVINSTKLARFTTELKIMQTEVNELYEKNKDGEDVSKYGQDISSASAEVQEQANKVFNELGISSDGYKFYDSSTIKDTLKIDGVEQEVFVNIEKRSVVSYKGIKYEDQMYYTLEQLDEVYNVEYEEPTADEPTFDVTYKKLANGTYKVTISNIQYNGNINKWYVKYQQDGQEYWSSTEDMSFVVSNPGKYKIQIENGSIKSATKDVSINEVNEPKLAEGMIPVKWNGTTWAKADEKNTNNDWYDYSQTNKKWANVVTVMETGNSGKTRQEYMDASVGTPIAEEDITTMFVWIPRYSYKITSGYHTNANGTGNIEIKFLQEKSDNFIGNMGEAKRTSITNGEDYVVHPSFTADTSLGGTGEEITGFWVGKFESSNSTATKNNADLSEASSSSKLYGGGNTTTLNVTIRPNVTSWRGINVNSIFTVCKAMNSEGNIHGLETDIDTTMMQNSQWGAVAYLAQSDYGNKQISTDSSSGIWNNPYNEGITTASTNSYGINVYHTTLTGMSGESRDKNTNAYTIKQNKNINSDGSVEIEYVDRSNTGTDGNPYTTKYYSYYTENGQKASTTRNIYGVYDMSGGAWEYMASYLGNATSNSYVNNFKSLNAKYQTSYLGTGETSSTEDRTINYTANQHIYGDAVWETSSSATGTTSWNGNHSNLPYFAAPFFARGGNFHSSSYAGVFHFWPTNAGEYNSSGFRVVAF